jgi:hypothetical protein
MSLVQDSTSGTLRNSELLGENCPMFNEVSQVSRKMKAFSIKDGTIGKILWGNITLTFLYTQTHGRLIRALLLKK